MGLVKHRRLQDGHGHADDKPPRRIRCILVRDVVNQTGRPNSQAAQFCSALAPAKNIPKIAIVNSKLVPAKSNASVVATSIQVEFHSSTNTNRIRARAGTRVSTTKANPKVVPRLCPRVLLSLRAANQTGMPVSSRSKIRTRSNKVTSLMAVAVAPRFHL